MLSTKLVQLIETNWQDIANRLARQVKNHPEMQALAARPEGELREWTREILSNLSHLLSTRTEAEFRRRFESLGRSRFEENIPLHEAVLRLLMLHELTVTYIHEHGFPMSALQLYAEEELEQRMCRFFHASVYHVVRGYETALRLESRLAS
jgi:hypothetical protein